jgi:ankyrin repeat protein
MTPLHLAAKEGKTEVIKVLLEAGASLSTVDKQSFFVTNLFIINIF